MSQIKLTREERQVVKSAIAGLKKAEARAIKSGTLISYVRDGQLYRKNESGDFVPFQMLPRRVKVNVRTKQAKKRG